MYMPHNFFAVHNREEFKHKVLAWISQFNIFCFLENSGYYHQDGFRCLVAIQRGPNGPQIVLHPFQDPFDCLYHFHNEHKQWIFGHLSYELNSGLLETRPLRVQFPQGFFFVPDILLELHNDGVSVLLSDCPEKQLMEEIEQCSPIEDEKNNVIIKATHHRASYLQALENVKAHIRRGDCYELNYCQEFFGDARINPATVYNSLNSISPNPFSAFYRVNNQYCLCASPERFVSKSGEVVVSQPIKGTTPRYVDSYEDERSRAGLAESKKDKSENVMVVDLVRNDLSRVCIPGSVTVPSLFSVYSFKGVHQMISTVMGRLEKHNTFADVLDVCFPMGSMTGAPKKRVMELIHRYELSGRGIYSGSIGYITPDQDMDFNVVIRSLLYDKSKEVFSFHAGGGITHYSDPEKEFEESLLKTKAIRKVLTGSFDTDDVVE